MPTFECVFPCIHNGARIAKGRRVTASDDQLKLPQYSALNNKTSFKRLPEDTPAAPASPADIKALREKCAALKLTDPEKATAEELQALIAEAASPAGTQTP